jgi:hypothetical protein
MRLSHQGVFIYSSETDEKSFQNQEITPCVVEKIFVLSTYTGERRNYGALHAIAFQPARIDQDIGCPHQACM